MPDESPLREIEASLKELGAVLQNDNADRMTVLKKAYVVNNEIGKALRSHLELQPGLAELQSWVNTITVGTRAFDMPKAVRGLQESLVVLERISKGERLSQKNL